MKLNQKQAVIILGAVFFVAILVVLIALNTRDPVPTGDGPSIELSFWGVGESRDFQQVIESYGKYRKNVKVKYTKFDESVYDQEVLNALASGEGPDILMLGNKSLEREKSKLSPVGSAQMSLVTFKDIFPQVVEQDFVRDDQIFAAPLYVDTLALFYNKDFFDQAAIVKPPVTWQEFQRSVGTLRATDESGAVKRAGAAIGGSLKSVSHAVDLLNLIMLQNGTEMVKSDNRTPAFNSSVNNRNLGLEAFNFYLQFANSGSNYYTWNDNMGRDTDAFAGERVAMIFGYSRDVEVVKDKNPFLNFSVAAVPQLEGSTKVLSYADYEGLAVSKQSEYGGWAWDFILFATTRQEVAKLYSDATGYPPAIKSLLEEKFSDVSQGVFARQALTARSWFQADDLKMSQIFSSAIEMVLNGQSDSRKALIFAYDQALAVMRR